MFIHESETTIDMSSPTRLLPDEPNYKYLTPSEAGLMKYRGLLWAILGPERTEEIITEIVKRSKLPQSYEVKNVR